MSTEEAITALFKATGGIQWAIENALSAGLTAKQIGEAMELTAPTVRHLINEWGLRGA